MISRLFSVFACSSLLLSGCDSAAIEPRDAGLVDAASADATPDAADAGPIEGGRDDGDVAPDAGVDLGPLDAGPPPDAGPELVVPAAPEAPPAVVIAWATDRMPEALAAADPMVEEVDAPVTMPCPPGWRERRIDVEDPPVCEPWPAASVPVCGAGAAAFPDVDGCEVVGGACPAGAWAAALPADAIYVQTGGSGSGTMGSPVGTLADALVLAAGRTGPVTIALARGSHTESVTLDRSDVTLVGACAAGTTLSAADGASPVIRVTGARGFVRGLTLEGGSEGTRVEAGASVSLDRVIVQRSGVALRVAGTLAGASIVARDVTGAAAIEVVGSGSIDATRVSIENAAARGVACEAAGSLLLRDVAVRAVGAEGVVAAGGCAATIERGIVEGATGLGVAARDAGTVVTLTQALVRGTRATSGGSGGYGLHASFDGTIEAHRFAVVGSIDNGVHVNAGVAVLTDGVIVDTAATPAGGFGIGLLVLEGGTADVTRLYVARSLDQGVGVWNDLSRLTASHLVVRDTRCNPAGFCGGSLSALGAAQVMVDHAKLEAAPSYGIRAYGGARLTASRTLVTGRPGVTAVGLRVGLEGDATLSFARIEGWTGAAVTTEPESAEDTGGAMAHLEDVVVAPGGADIADLAVALRSVAAGTIDGTNVVLAGSTGTAAEARGAGSSVRLTGAIVADTASSRTPSRAALQASEGGAVDVVSAEILRSAGTAVSATDGSSLALSAVRASDSAGPAVVVAGAGSLAMLGSVAIVGHELAAVLVDAASLDAMDLRIDAPARVARRTDGLVAIGGAIVRVDRIEVSGARGVGVGAWGSSTSLTLSNARISGTAMEGGVAASLGLYEDPTFDVSRFACDDAAPATGLQLLPTPSRALGVGWVRDHAVGVAASTTTGLDVVVGEVVLLDVRAAIEAPSARDAPAAPVLE